jgi:hypothetical protein
MFLLCAAAACVCVCVSEDTCFLWFIYCSCLMWATRWRSWLRHCATSREIAGSIPDGITGIFH